MEENVCSSDLKFTPINLEKLHWKCLRHFSLVSAGENWLTGTTGKERERKIWKIYLSVCLFKRNIFKLQVLELYNFNCISQQTRFITTWVLFSPVIMSFSGHLFCWYDEVVLTEYWLRSANRVTSVKIGPVKAKCHHLTQTSVTVYKPTFWFNFDLPCLVQLRELDDGWYQLDDDGNVRNILTGYSNTK